MTLERRYTTGAGWQTVESNTVEGTWQGPFNITSQTLPGNGDPLVILDISPGQIIFDAALLITTNFGGGGAVSIGLGIAERGNSGVTFTQLGTGTFDGTAAAGSDFGFFIISNVQSSFPPVVVIGDCEVAAYLDTGNVGSSGNGDFYLLIGPIATT